MPGPVINAMIASPRLTAAPECPLKPSSFQVKRGGTQRELLPMTGFQIADLGKGGRA